MKKYNTPKDDIEQFINTFSKSKDSLGDIIGVEIWFDNLAHVVIPEKHIAYLQMDGITKNIGYCAAASNSLVVNDCFDSFELAISNKMANIEYTGFDAEEDMTVFNRIEAYNDIIGVAVITVVDSDPLRFLGGEHSFCVNVLGIRKNSYEDNDLQNLTGERIYHLKGLAGEVHLHLLTNDGVEMQRFLIFLTPLGVVLAELPIRVKLQSTIPAFLGVPVPENHKGHVLSRRHVLFDRLIVRHLIAEISTGNRRVLPIDRLCDTVVGDSLRERIAKALAFLECTQEVIDTRGAGVERLGYRHATHT